MTKKMNLVCAALRPRATLGIAVFGVTISLLTVPMGQAEKAANQLQLKNCGGYTIGSTKAQYRKDGAGNWRTIKKIGDDIGLAQVLCVDFSDYTDADGNALLSSDDQIRLVASIAGGGHGSVRFDQLSHHAQCQ